MSAPQRRQQQPHQYQQQYYQPQQQHAAQQYAHDPTYSGYPATPYHPQQQQQVYQQSQPYPSADPYAFTRNVQHSAFSTSHPQITPYEGSWPHRHYVSPSGTSNHDPAHAAYPQAGGYLTAADYAASAGDFSPNPASTSDRYDGYSHGQSAGRSHLNNFASHGASPSLESQVAHMNISGPTNALPNKSTTYQHDFSNAQTHSGMEHSSIHTDSAAGAREPRSEISLRYPPLPSLPERCVTPPSLQSKRSTSHDENPSEDVDPAVLTYITSLRTTLSTYEKRDDLLRLRTEAVGFQPRQAWSAWQSQQDASTADTHSSADDSVSTNPVLGVRLLQRLDKLQRENDELGRLLTARTRDGSGSGSVEAVETEQLRSEIRDCHRLIQAMDKALVDAEARATASERALQVACMNHSTAMVPAPNGEAAVTAAASGKSRNSEEKKPTAATTSKPPARRGSKQPNPNAGASVKSSASQQQQQHRTTNKPHNASSPATKAGGGAKSTRGDTSSTASTDAKSSKSVKSK
ncbi:GATA type zinc finger protein Asd4 [Pseudozyma hubeiensis SY62]|uniref:GATA type zinc finger protein Asd4 n=1 Tax=Pseudozyma hubeiensis (strain SY62) TaxID=1305764 RepID=R9P4S7_PSEHS|nr:GATA type zinc finger protein Asd4 [Pseudozyma hubeiensis SY62]GAC96438.1 GATA type zinc finger protein Asd4 [Pseudozyma hubeiensis SY62]